MQKLSELNITTNEEVKKCLPALQGKWYSTYNYYYVICAIDNPSEHNDSLPVVIIRFPFTLITNSNIEEQFIIKIRFSLRSLTNLM